ncbi:MAG: sugar phosphate isomerase/epimerase family protein [Cyclobacteriaceae bacterium]|nr:sugar phosphate isomerase/epimerase family protein [Cyclobacteriaceae bacterium]
MKNKKSRRTFLKNTLAAGSLAFIPFSGNVFAASRKFTLELNPGAIGVKLDQQQLLEKAAEYGFESIVAFSGTLAEWSDGQIKDFNALMKSKKIVWGTSGLPMDFRRDEETQKKGITELPKHAAALQKAGVTRMSTWIMPTDANLTYMQNMKQHGARLREAARVLADYNIVLGLEYVGPKTLMARDKYSFVHTLAECRELIAEINAPNVGVQLDSFHWFCAGETKADLLTLTNKDIVTVDLNDAKAGVTAADQLDGKRELPMATGVVDMKSFLEALVAIGYDGPCRAEPFNQVLNDMEDNAAIKATADAMKKAVNLLG